ncbi:MAG TPA: 23S rRNA (guanosine(2251)-2'-O)-methyltransferase RlmB [Steroidobacteraceae bacterium]|nr:23S rRNA (guanosine(2251)-2'-O)-methyltransferase RlmB [Steroidobacteraceae bacterium]
MGEQALVHGWHAVRWLLRRHPERVRQIWIQRGREDSRAAEIMDLARVAGTAIQHAEVRTLDAMSGEASHQGVIASVAPAQPWDDARLQAHLETLKDPALLLLLDGIQDPHNLGACLRTADACGVHAVIVPRDRAVGLNATVRKVAAGAAETVPLVTVTNLARAMRALKERGIWLIGAVADAVQRSQQADLAGPVGIVMGSEGEGLRRLTRESCDLLVSLPMVGAIESLNVSVATGMILYEAVRQRGGGARQ